MVLSYSKITSDLLKTNYILKLSKKRHLLVETIDHFYAVRNKFHLVTPDDIITDSVFLHIFLCLFKAFFITCITLLENRFFGIFF